jgi:hypothetical protein
VQPLLQREKTVSITYFEGVSVALGTQHAMGMRHIVICGMPGYTYFHLIHKRHDSRGEKVTEHKTCILF